VKSLGKFCKLSGSLSPQTEGRLPFLKEEILLEKIIAPF